jgi:Holliday junction resolvase
MSETELSRAIVHALSSLGWWVLRIQSGVIPAMYGNTRRYIHCAEPGTPDLLAMKGGAVVFLEVKTPKGALEASQVAWHQRAIREGLQVAVVRAVSDAVQAVQARREQ